MAGQGPLLDLKPIFLSPSTQMDPWVPSQILPGDFRDQRYRNPGFQPLQKIRSQQGSPLYELSWSKIADDIDRFRRTVRDKVSGDKWVMELKNVWTSYGAFCFTFLILLVAAQYLLNRSRLYLKNVSGKIDKSRFPYRHLSGFIVQRSLLLAGGALFVYLYFLAAPASPVLRILRFIATALTVVLYTRWVRYFVRYWFLEQAWIQEREAARVNVMLTGVRYGAVLYSGISELTGIDSTLSAVLRVLIELFLLIWVINFWNNFQKESAAQERNLLRWRFVILSVSKTLSFAFIGGGIVMDLLGYGFFSIYWYASLGSSLVILLWAGVFFLLLGEWRQELKAKTADAAEEEDTQGRPFKWVVLQLSWLIGLAVFSVLLIFAWGDRQFVIGNIIHMLNYPVSIGKIQFSIMNVINAFIVIVLTHTLARLWRFILKDKILADSGLNLGLQDSITMISVYAIWGFGIMLSLHTFGMGTTTLAFAFGALGIGLGFGLQNIFNNFISGIILLFERPIQVGDDVEINGTWATVKKINVRATVVQTYDNASIIIPNSEFISSQVTNWSFKDKRLRRNIDVGVAYGSDIELVRQTLLDIAGKAQKVFKQPRPDVLFRDFGDSALMFRLRVWTDIDSMLKVETDIRFEIDRRFKEKGIVIAFPQMDVHLVNT
jgi:potassium efflux system protein